MGSTETTPSPTVTAAAERPPAGPCVGLAVHAARDRKAQDLRILDLGAVSDFTDRFLICSGTSDRHVQAIADLIVERLREAGLRPLHVEGYDHASWVLLDYGGELVAHVFLEPTRKFYNLERLWSDATDVTGEYPE